MKRKWAKQNEHEQNDSKTMLDVKISLLTKRIVTLKSMPVIPDICQRWITVLHVPCVGLLILPLLLLLLLLLVVVCSYLLADLCFPDIFIPSPPNHYIQDQSCHVLILKALLKCRIRMPNILAVYLWQYCWVCQDRHIWQEYHDETTTHGIWRLYDVICSPNLILLL